MTEWVDDDELTITYRTLRQGMREAQEAERNRIVELLAEADETVLPVALLGGLIALIKGEAK